MAISRDEKDWTWVLSRPCPECGFDASSFPCRDVGAALRDNAARWRALLTQPEVRERPSTTVWSALEYGCHVRDVFRLFTARLELMLTEDDPLFQNWDQDESAVTDRYADQDPATVTEQLEIAGATLAGRLEVVALDEWLRAGRRSDGAAFTVDSFARYLLHDPVHHLHDVQRGYAVLESRG